MKKVLVISALFLACSTWSFASPNVGQQKKANGLNKTAAGCNQTTAVIDMDINNVRARLMTGGDMWWDRANGNAQYEVPKGSNKNALFAGSLWIGGFDHGTGDLKVAAQTYRQSGNDFWTGPLDETNGATIDFQTCADWDRFWKINATDVNAFKALYAACNGDQACINQTLSANSGAVPDVIKEWPGRKSPFALGSTNGPLSVPDRDMAPFVDINNDNVYNWRDGDYPAILGDQYIWWVYNDKGDAKTETQSDAIGIEVHAGAFAFSTSDCLNEATFYNYRVYNWSTSILDSTYMATWTDADLGYAFDDYIGCDTSRGLGILYNGDSYDESSTGYGFDIPMVAVDFFRGPRFQDPVTLDTIELGMSVFTYYNNDFTRTGNPDTRDDFYGYMTGTWKDGSYFVSGCNPEALSGTPIKKVFPSDPCDADPNATSEPTCNRVPFDRRFVHSSGPFSLVPGSLPSDITIGCVWVPNAGYGSGACFSKIQICDDKAQNLFDSDFKLPFGPQAPDLTAQPLDQKIVMQLSNPASSNNANELYGRDLSNPYALEASTKAVKNDFADSLYKFEGYIVYQLANSNVALSDIRMADGSINTSKARIAYQCDLSNRVSKILNFEVNPEISADYYQPKLMVSGADAGIKHSFQITQDLFSTGTSKDLVNYKTYYFMAVAYAYNKFDNDDPDDEPNDFDASNALKTQDIQYLESRTNGREMPIQVIAVMPQPATDNIYVQNYAEYGTGIQLTRIEGIGNGGRWLEMTQTSVDEILSGGNNHVYHPTYEGNYGPVDIFVTNPDSVVAGQYELAIKPKARFSGTNNSSLGAIGDSTTWELKNLTTGETVYSERNISTYYDQLIQKWGLSVGLKQVIRPGDDDSTSVSNGFITSFVTFEDINSPWLGGVRDVDGKSFNNWILAGEETESLPNGCALNDWPNGDRGGEFEDVINGTWAPYNLVSNLRDIKCGYGFMFNSVDRSNYTRMQNLQSVDVVFTSDQSKWTRCPVIEMSDAGNSNPFGEGGQYKFNMRRHPAWDKGVDGNGNPTYNNSDSGWSWFPGYAINLETGERLNIMFGEESINATDNGNDMIFNPTDRSFDPTNFQLLWGGKHVVYIQNTKYDQGNWAISKLKNANIDPSRASTNQFDLRELYRTVMWVGNVMKSPAADMASLKDGLIPTTTKVSIRVERPYDTYLPDASQSVRNNEWPLYSFNTFDLAPAMIGDGRNQYSNDKDALLARIHPVPNPYYAFSEYENDRLDTKVRIINLPEKATIKIYTIDGTLVRTLVKNDSKTSYLDWDIKNSQNISVGSGMYLMHVDIPNIGQTVLKWFGAMRPTDITSF